MQANHTKEATERMLLLSYVHKAAGPLAKAYVVAASYPYPVNSPAVMDALVKRLIGASERVIHFG